MLTVTMTMMMVMTMGTAALQAKPGGRLCQVTEMMECERVNILLVLALVLVWLLLLLTMLLPQWRLLLVWKRLPQVWSFFLAHFCHRRCHRLRWSSQRCCWIPLQTPGGILFGTRGTDSSPCSSSASFSWHYRRLRSCCYYCCLPLPLPLPLHSQSQPPLPFRRTP